MDARLGAYARAMDPRLKAGLALLYGALIWRCGPLGLALLGLVILALGLGMGGFVGEGLRLFKAAALFVIFWALVKLAVDLLSGIGPWPAAANALVLAARLSELLGLGLILALSTSARQLGLAAAWALRPFLRDRAWQAALGLSLMVHFLPLALGLVSDLRRVVSLRCPDLSLAKKLIILPQAMIRNLGQKTWDQTLAVASRGLDQASAWRTAFSGLAGQWFFGAGLGLAGLALALV
ncbi:MAG: cobalt transporter [Desulfovibrionaceae bacterium]|nr:cobalt transporter [Desulfovibrionaceae bacterium]